jgi:hypothetical protein
MELNKVKTTGCSPAMLVFDQTIHVSLYVSQDTWIGESKVPMELENPRLLISSPLNRI